MAGLVGKDGERYLWVLDPVTRKLRVPMHLLVPTQATTIAGSVPSLCLAYLEGRCRHPWCRQAHVHPHAIQQLRHEALNAPTCCPLHGDPHDTGILIDRFDTVTISDSPHIPPIPTNRVALTVGLQRYLAHSISPELRGGNLELPLKLICRLHQSQRCRYMEDCNNIHICRELELRLMPPPHMLAPLTSLHPSTQNVNIGDVSYAVTMVAPGDVTDEEFGKLCEMHNPKNKPSKSKQAPGGSSSDEDKISPNSPPGQTTTANTTSSSTLFPPMHSHDDMVGGMNASTSSFNGNWSVSGVPNTPPLAGKPANGTPTASGSAVKTATPTTPLALPIPMLPTGPVPTTNSPIPAGHGMPGPSGSTSSPIPPPYGIPNAPLTPTLAASNSPLPPNGMSFTSLKVYDVRRAPVKCQ